MTDDFRSLLERVLDLCLFDSMRPIQTRRCTISAQTTREFKKKRTYLPVVEGNGIEVDEDGNPPFRIALVIRLNRAHSRVDLQNLERHLPVFYSKTL